jgi:hypothetical protein
VALIVPILFLLPLVSLPPFPLRVLALLILALLVLLRIDLNFHFTPPECCTCGKRHNKSEGCHVDLPKKGIDDFRGVPCGSTLS